VLAVDTALEGGEVVGQRWRTGKWSAALEAGAPLVPSPGRASPCDPR
jgi:hypothetical protein